MMNKQLRLEQARHLQREGCSIRKIAKQTGISKSTIHRLLQSVTPIEVVPVSPTECDPSAVIPARERSAHRLPASKGLVRVKTPLQPQAVEVDREIARKNRQLGALTNELSTKEQQRNALERQVGQQRHQLDQLNQEIAQKRAELVALERRLVDLPIQQQALLRGQEQLDWERQTFALLLTKTRSQVETYHTFRIRFVGEGLVADYNGLIQELLAHCDHCQWYAKSLDDFMTRRGQLRREVADFCHQHGLLPASLLLVQGLDYMGQDMAGIFQATKGFRGAKAVEIHFGERHIQRYQAYLVTEIAQPKPFLALPVPLSPFQLME